MNSSSLILNPVHFSIISYLLKVYSILSTGNKSNNKHLCVVTREGLLCENDSVYYIFIE